jgi:predicted metal-binding membrane protein
MIAAACPLERLLHRDGTIVLGSLIGLSLLAWLYLILLSVAMARGDMSLMGMEAVDAMGEAMAMQVQPWGMVTFALMLVMWWIMMIGMMVPSAAPMILLFARVQRRKLPDDNPALRTALFTSGYLVLWLAFSLIATTLQWTLTQTALLSPMMAGRSPVLGAVIFAAAGLYQVSPLKQACLRHCQSPLQFLSRHWRKGNRGAWSMGLKHGSYCVGCCWFLMALLFVGGVMNLLWVAAIAIVVLLEKILPRNPWTARLSGSAMLVFAAYLIAAPTN